MGQRANRLKLFLQKHPWCCYCGGKAAAETEDHWPPRAAFFGRRWPDGYVFPACALCNHFTSNHEALFALVCMMVPANHRFTTEAANQFNKAVRAQRHRHPEVMQSIDMTANAKRAVFRSNGWQLPQGESFGNFPLINISHPRFRESVELCGQKLLLSLYYRHIGRPLPRTGSAVMQWVTNTFQAQGELDTLMAKMPDIGRPVHHHTTPLGDQFSYRCYADRSRGLAAFIVTLHGALAIIGVLSDEGEVAWQAGKAWNAFGVLPSVEHPEREQLRDVSDREET